MNPPLLVACVLYHRSKGSCILETLESARGFTMPKDAGPLGVEYWCILGEGWLLSPHVSSCK